MSTFPQLPPWESGHASYVAEFHPAWLQCAFTFLLLIILILTILQSAWWRMLGPSLQNTLFLRLHLGQDLLVKKNPNPLAPTLICPRLAGAALRLKHPHLQLIHQQAVNLQRGVSSQSNRTCRATQLKMKISRLRISACGDLLLLPPALESLLANTVPRRISLQDLNLHVPSLSSVQDCENHLHHQHSLFSNHSCPPRQQQSLSAPTAT